MFLIVIDLVLWTTARHEASHGLLAWLEGRPVAPSFCDGLKTQQVIDAAIASDQRGTRVSLE